MSSVAASAFAAEQENRDRLNEHIGAQKVEHVDVGLLLKSWKIILNPKICLPHSHCPNVPCNIAG